MAQLCVSPFNNLSGFSSRLRLRLLSLFKRSHRHIHIASLTSEVITMLSTMLIDGSDRDLCNLSRDAFVYTSVVN